MEMGKRKRERENEKKKSNRKGKGEALLRRGRKTWLILIQEGEEMWGVGHERVVFMNGTFVCVHIANSCTFEPKIPLNIMYMFSVKYLSFN